MHHRPELHHWCQGYMEIQLLQIVALNAMIQSVTGQTKSIVSQTLFLVK